MISDFITYWSGKGSEKSETQKFWLALLRDFLNVETPEEFIEFEMPVELSHMSFIDAYIPSTGIIIEQKSSDIDLDKPQTQSDGTSATPFEQAKRYYDWLPASQKGRYIIVCNFRELRIHDMETPKARPLTLTLERLRPQILPFLIRKNAEPPREVAISFEAGELVKKLRDSLLTRYIHPNSKESRKSLNIFCVRMVFLLYAEDSGLFRKAQFHNYLKARELTARDALQRLFVVLSQKPHERDPYLDDDLAAFPCVNGGLFDNRDIEFPKIDGEPLRIILQDMSEGFDWSEINPTIFGALFESTLHENTRESGGMHYTTIENIHKVIDPMFLDELKAELANSKTKDDLEELRGKLRDLTFLDPACGSGNFLTETYISLCRLEMEIVRRLGEIPFLQVSISQFYGIEIEDFAVAVAKTALWIARIQMFKEINPSAKLDTECLPLDTNNNIHEANAVTSDWRKVIAPEKLNYIISNPPFLGYAVRNSDQRKELEALYGKSQATGKLDYVAGWYYKAAEFIQGTEIRAAFVSTNSITQGEQVATVFKTLRDKFDIHIDFAHSTFTWNSEAAEQAHVHVVIICVVSGKRPGKKRLITAGRVRLADCISFYLIPGEEMFAESTVYPVCEGVPAMRGGNMPLDGGYLLINSPEELEEFLKKCPQAERFIKRFMGGYEFINNVPRWCLWLVDAKPQELHDMPAVMERLKLCRESRLASTDKGRQKLANTPWLFRETLNLKQYLAIPKTSSERRYYIPIGWLDDSVIPGDALRIVPGATLYDFGVLTSRGHMGWMRRVSGRLKSDYRYSARISYNTFVWPELDNPTLPPLTQGRNGQVPLRKGDLGGRNTTQDLGGRITGDLGGRNIRAKIERTAQGILDARKLYPESSFASLYSEVTMPPELRKAHELNDVAVCEAYGWRRDIEEDELVDLLFRKYYALTGKTI